MSHEEMEADYQRLLARLAAIRERVDRLEARLNKEIDKI